jgi:hypothetical protein
MDQICLDPIIGFYIKKQKINYMLETFLTFTLFGSGIAFGIMLLLLFISLIITELHESGEWAATFIAIAVGLNYF